VSVQYSDIPLLSSLAEHRETSFKILQQVKYETDLHDTIGIFCCQTNHVSLPAITHTRIQEHTAKAHSLQQLLCPRNLLRESSLPRGHFNTCAQRVSNSSTGSVLGLSLPLYSI